MRVYIAGPYRADTPEGVDRHIEIARQAMADLLRMGHTPFCPHSMTARFERDYPDIEDRRYLETDLEWLRFCDGILLLPAWRESSGSKAEFEVAKVMGLDIFQARLDADLQLVYPGLLEVPSSTPLLSIASESNQDTAQSLRDYVQALGQDDSPAAAQATLALSLVAQVQQVLDKLEVVANDAGAGTTHTHKQPDENTTPAPAPTTPAGRCYRCSGAIGELFSVYRHPDGTDRPLCEGCS